MTPSETARALVDSGDVEAVARLVEALQAIRAVALFGQVGNLREPIVRHCNDAMLTLPFLATLPAAKEGLDGSSERTPSR